MKSTRTLLAAALAAGGLAVVGPALADRGGGHGGGHWSGGPHGGNWSGGVALVRRRSLGRLPLRMAARAWRSTSAFRCLVRLLLGRALLLPSALLRLSALLLSVSARTRGLSRRGCHSPSGSRRAAAADHRGRAGRGHAGAGPDLHELLRVGQGVLPEGHDLPGRLEVHPFEVGEPWRPRRRTPPRPRGRACGGTAAARARCACRSAFPPAAGRRSSAPRGRSRRE